VPRPARLLAITALTLLLLDQVTKAWALRALTLGQSIPVVPGLFHLTLVKNPGVAFGLFARCGGLVTAAAFVIVGGMVAVALRPPISRAQVLAAGLILGGAIGNVVDRLRFGGVVDFFDFRVWPVFNVADSGITVGTILLAWCWWKGR